MNAFKPENPYVDNADSWQEDIKHLHGLGEQRRKSEIEIMLDKYVPLSEEEANILNDLAEMEKQRELLEIEATELFTLGHKIEAIKKLKELADRHKVEYDRLLSQYAKIA